MACTFVELYNHTFSYRNFTLDSRKNHRQRPIVKPLGNRLQPTDFSRTNNGKSSIETTPTHETRLLCGVKKSNIEHRSGAKLPGTLFRLQNEFNYTNSRLIIPDYILPSFSNKYKLTFRSSVEISFCSRRLLEATRNGDTQLGDNDDGPKENVGA